MSNLREQYQKDHSFFYFRVILFWGGIWGIQEAVFGYILHWLRIPGLPGMLMFPIGLWCMWRAYTATGKQASIFYTAVLASLFKLADFGLPLSSAEMAVNPSFAILCEGLCAGIMLTLRKSEKPRNAAAVLWPAAILWRLCYSGGLGVLYLLGIGGGVWRMGFPDIPMFFLIEPASNIALIFILFSLPVSWILRSEDEIFPLCSREGYILSQSRD